MNTRSPFRPASPPLPSPTPSHAYPTLSEINRFAALQSQDAWLTGYRVQGARHLKRFSDWFQALKI